MDITLTKLKEFIENHINMNYLKIVTDGKKLDLYIGQYNTECLQNMFNDDTYVDIQYILNYSMVLFYNEKYKHIFESYRYHSNIFNLIYNIKSYIDTDIFLIINMNSLNQVNGSIYIENNDRIPLTFKNQDKDLITDIIIGECNRYYETLKRFHNISSLSDEDIMRTIINIKSNIKQSDDIGYIKNLISDILILNNELIHRDKMKGVNINVNYNRC